MIPILVLTVLIMSSLGYGLLGLRIISCPNSPSWGEDYGRAFALGIGVLGWLVFWFGISGLLQSWILWGILLPGVLSFWYLNKNLKIFSFKDIGKISWVLLMVLILMVFLDLLEALAPPADADTLAYHFALPKQFLKNGVIEFVPIVVDGAIPLLTHMTYILALGLGGETSLTLWSFTTQIFLLIAIYGIGRRWLSREWSLALVLVFETTPAIIYGGGSGHMEVRTAIFMLIGTKAIAEWANQSSFSLVILAGFMAGFFMGSKYFGLYAATGIGTVILMQKNFWRTGMLFSIVVLLSGGQWYGWNWHHTGMPVFPTMYHFMGSPVPPYWSEAFHQTFNQELGYVCVPTNPLWLILYPIASTFNPESCFDSGRVGLGPLLWLLLPGVLYGLWYHRRRFKDSMLFKFSIPVTVYYFLWFLIPSNQMTRHLVPVYPVGILFASVVIHHSFHGLNKTFGHLLWKMSVTICILMGLLVQTLFAINYAKYHLTQETRDAFYLRNIGHYNVVQWINENLNASDKVGNPVRYLNYLIEIPYYSLRSTQSLIEKYLPNEKRDVYNQLKKQNITHVICDLDSNFSNKKYFETNVFSSRTLNKSTKSSCNIVKL